jgi:AcrR family transcriptional regulator
MPSDKQQRLTAAATELSHRIGLPNASIAAIAAEAGVPVGNVYYYFKTKDDLAAAVIESRRGQYAELRRTWDAASQDPIERLLAFVRHTRDTAVDLTAHGCPIGGLCRDLACTSAALGSDAGRIFADTIDWAAGHYGAAGHHDSDGAARRLVALLQGATVLAHALDDAELLRAECERVERDIHTVTLTSTGE